MSKDTWSRYVRAMRAHLAANERLADRLRYFVGDAFVPPLALTKKELEDWHDLVIAAELMAREHREALDALLKEAEAHG